MSQKLHSYKAESYAGIYSLHKYWSKKPHNIISNLIKKYSEKGDIVLDSFLGSGISVIEGITLGRKLIGIDINPAAVFITRQLISKVDVNKLSEVFKKIEENVKDEINSFYQVNSNGKNYVASHFIWNDTDLNEVWYKNGEPRLTKRRATLKDKQLAKSFSLKSIRNFFPKGQLFENARINVKKGDKISNLFSPRNLKAISLINNQIELIEDESIKNILMFGFTSILGQASKMVFVIKKKINKKDGKKINRECKSVGSWVIGYWKPQEHFEINVWSSFERKFNKILKIKKEQEENLVLIKERKSFKSLRNSKDGYLLVNKPAQKVLKKIPANSIDYVITDPPHGDRIPYLELSQMWNSWLKKEVNFKDEIIISSSKERNKTFKNYNRLLNNVFKEIFRVLKPGKKFTLMFNSLDDDTWINIIRTLNTIGFQLKKIETLSYSSNSVVQDNRETGLKTDFVLTYEKTTTEPKSIELLNGYDGEQLLNELINKFTAEDKQIERYEILNNLFFELLKKNRFFKLSQALKLIENLN